MRDTERSGELGDRRNEGKERGRERSREGGKGRGREGEREGREEGGKIFRTMSDEEKKKVGCDSSLVVDHFTLGCVVARVFDGARVLAASVDASPVGRAVGVGPALGRRAGHVRVAL